MLGVGWTEMMVIGVVALIVIGPKDLPVVMRQIGRYAGMIRRMGSEFQREINKATGLDEVRNLRNSITAPLKQTTDEIRREFNAMSANGTVKPNGVIKPADPAAESVVNEIHAAAGMTPPKLDTAQPVMVPLSQGTPETVKTGPVKAAPIKGAPLTATPLKAKRVAKATPAPTSPVAIADLGAISPKDIPLAMVAPAEPIKGAVVPGADLAPSVDIAPKPVRKRAPLKAAVTSAPAPDAPTPATAPVKLKAAPKPRTAPAKPDADKA